MINFFSHLVQFEHTHTHTCQFIAIIKLAGYHQVEILINNHLALLSTKLSKAKLFLYTDPVIKQYHYLSKCTI